jgi:hypothetical protein
MQIYMKEKIGKPELFTGRKKELAYYMNWIDRIKIEASKSSAILSRRKTGKSALMQRLYNLTFAENDNVVPFYYEIKESPQWIFHFAVDFFLEFIYQYVAFKSRKKEYIENKKKTFKDALVMVKKEKLNYLTEKTEEALYYADEGSYYRLWDIARDAPRIIAGQTDGRVVQLIDEFQYINTHIYYDEKCASRINDFIGSYFHTVEYMNAPLLVSGSWVGWLLKDISKLLPGRVLLTTLEDMPKEESVEMIFKYSEKEEIEITEQTAFLMAQLCEGNPFYISSVMRSSYPDKDITTEEGLLKTIEFETTNTKGGIHSGWMEYIHSALERVNDKNAKKIVIYLAKNRHKEVGRREIMKDLKLDMTDEELEGKLEVLVYNNIIEQGRSNFYYQGVRDNIFDKVFRSRYADDIQEFDPLEITNEYKALFEEYKKKYKALEGDFNRYRGIFSEFTIINKLKHKAKKNNEAFKSMMKNLPDDFEFEDYESVWSYTASPVYKKDFQIDIFADAKTGYSLLGEVRNKKDKKFSKKDTLEFEAKAKELIKLENVQKPLLFIFSASGFTRTASDYMKDNNIAWTKDKKWLKKSS